MRKTHSKVIVYHDETSSVGSENYLGHVLFFIPLEVNVSECEGFFKEQLRINPQEKLIKKVKHIRNDCNANHKFHFTDISGKKWYQKDNADRNLVECAVDALKIKNLIHFSTPLYCKLAIIFYPKCNRSSLDQFGGEEKKEKSLRYDETLLRMLLKGAVHYLYDENHSIEIYKIITDGYPNHRSFDRRRIVDRLVQDVDALQLRSFVSISPEVEIIPLHSDHKMFDEESNSYKHANFLQIADMLLGSTIQACYKNCKYENGYFKIGDRIQNKKSIVSIPVKDMIEKTKRGRNFKYSSHFGTFALSQAIPSADGWEFKKVKSNVVIDEYSDQLLFPF